MRNYLVRSSLFFAIFLYQLDGFSQVENTSDCKQIFVPNFINTKYRAAIDVIGKHLSGILIFKMQEDSSVRAVFVNEMGSTFFDITFGKTSYTYNSIMNSLSKKAVKRTLAKDLGMILLRGIFSSFQNISQQEKYITLKLQRKGSVYYYPNTTCKQYPLLENHGRKKVISISQHYADNATLPDSIFVQHHKVDFTISLKQMHVTE